MAVNINTEEAPYRASHAVLLYGKYGASYASVHDVELDEDGALKIAVGTPATIAGLRQMFERLDPSRKLRPSYFAPHILSQGPGWLVWWVKPQLRRVWFNGAGFKEETAVVPHPGLVFAVSPAGWSVFALAGKTRPRSGTKLFQAPYFNVWKGGAICVGSAETPQGLEVQDSAQWERSFYDSRFSHSNVHEKDQLLKYKGGPVKFWKDMLNGKFDVFPREVLVPSDRTVASLLQKIGGSV